MGQPRLVPGRMAATPMTIVEIRVNLELRTYYNAGPGNTTRRWRWLITYDVDYACSFVHGWYPPGEQPRRIPQGRHVTLRRVRST